MLIWTIDEDLWLWSEGCVIGVIGSISVLHAYVPGKGVQLALALMSPLGNWFGKVCAKESLKMGRGIFCGVSVWVRPQCGGSKSWAIFNK